MSQKRTCSDCEFFGKNVDKGGVDYCWSGLFEVNADDSICIAFEPKEKKGD